MKHKKTKNILKWISIGAGIFIVLSIFAYLAKIYPVLYVNGKMITGREYETDMAITFNYLKNMAMSKKENLDSLNSKEVINEYKKNVLEALIEQTLIHSYLEETMKNDDFKTIVKNKIALALEGKDIKKGVETLYGVSMNNFKKIVLVPEAEREIIEGRFFIDNKNFDDWLKEEKKKAKINIFISGVSWTGERIEVK